METIDIDNLFAQFEALGQVSESDEVLLRRCLTREHRRANEMVDEWMRDAGLQTHTDAIGNIIGRYEGLTPGAPALVFGSHLDTVRNAGKYDGILGVLLPIACIRRLHEAGERLPFALEVVGFCDEEGVRFQSTLLGSRALSGSFDTALLDRADADGISMRDAMSAFGLQPERLPEAARRRESILAYVETHIEQGPVLEAEGLPVGTVTSICGANRMQVNVGGSGGHAGTVPMHLRRDPLIAAAAMVTALNDYCRRGNELVGTAGMFEVRNGAVNVIPADVVFSVDMRAADDDVRIGAVNDVKRQFADIAAEHQVALSIVDMHEGVSCRCAPWLMMQLDQAISAAGHAVRRLPSGAGHDAMALSELVPVGMLFVRCKGGISHHPDESMTPHDATVAGQVLLHFIRHFKLPE